MELPRKTEFEAEIMREIRALIGQINTLAEANKILYFDIATFKENIIEQNRTDQRQKANNNKQQISNNKQQIREREQQIVENEQKIKQYFSELLLIIGDRKNIRVEISFFDNTNTTDKMIGYIIKITNSLFRISELQTIIADRANLGSSYGSEVVLSMDPNKPLIEGGKTLIGISLVEG